MLFTWASAARAPRYVYDLNSALVARGKLKEISDILTRTRAESFDIFAHSMGAFLTMEGLVDAAKAGTLGSRAEIDHIVLASPDIDIDLFRTQIGYYRRWRRGSGCISSSRGTTGPCWPRGGSRAACRASAPRTWRSWKGSGSRSSTCPRSTNSSSGSHAKFSGSPEVVQLIGAGLNSVGNFGGSATPGLDELLAGVPIRILGP